MNNDFLNWSEIKHILSDMADQTSLPSTPIFGPTQLPGGGLVCPHLDGNYGLPPRVSKDEVTENRKQVLNCDEPPKTIPEAIAMANRTGLYLMQINESPNDFVKFARHKGAVVSKISVRNQMGVQVNLFVSNEYLDLYEFMQLMGLGLGDSRLGSVAQRDAYLIPGSLVSHLSATVVSLPGKTAVVTFGYPIETARARYETLLATPTPIGDYTRYLYRPAKAAPKTSGLTPKPHVIQHVLSSALVGSLAQNTKSYAMVFGAGVSLVTVHTYLPGYCFDKDITINLIAPAVINGATTVVVLSDKPIDIYDYYTSLLPSAFKLVKHDDKHLLLSVPGSMLGVFHDRAVGFKWGYSATAPILDTNESGMAQLIIVDYDEHTAELVDSELRTILNTVSVEGSYTRQYYAPVKRIREDDLPAEDPVVTKGLPKASVTFGSELASLLTEQLREASPKPSEAVVDAVRTKIEAGIVDDLTSSDVLHLFAMAVSNKSSDDFQHSLHVELDNVDSVIQTLFDEGDAKTVVAAIAKSLEGIDLTGFPALTIAGFTYSANKRSVCITLQIDVTKLSESHRAGLELRLKSAGVDAK